MKRIEPFFKQKKIFENNGYNVWRWETLYFLEKEDWKLGTLSNGEESLKNMFNNDFEKWIDHAKKNIQSQIDVLESNIKIAKSDIKFLKNFL